MYNNFKRRTFTRSKYQNKEEGNKALHFQTEWKFKKIEP